MDDAVGEVLAERKALDRGAGAGVALSLLLHGVITAAAVYAALRTPSQESVPMVEIKFAKMPAPVTPQDEGRLKPAAPQPKPVPQPKPQPVVEQAKPVVTQAPPKTVPLSPFGKSTKKGAEQPVAAPQPAPVDIPTGGTGAVVEGDFPYTIYIDRMKILVGAHWYRPQVAPGVATTVVFVVDRDGTIRDAATETPSGNGTFDRAALRAVLESSPLPPLPFAYNGTYVRIHLTFK